MENFTDEDLEELAYYQDNETQTLSDSDDEIEEADIGEMDEHEMIKNIKFVEETKEKFEKRNLGSAKAHPVVPENMRNNGIGTDIIKITEKILNFPGDFYDLLYRSSFFHLLFVLILR